ncbi:MAG: hypothetical protein GY755_06105 [Chloroflexi bacterium]|nr:hypothetical protein [Chloroflexota bacterium]
MPTKVWGEGEQKINSRKILVLILSTAYREISIEQNIRLDSLSRRK